MVYNHVHTFIRAYYATKLRCSWCHCHFIEPIMLQNYDNAKKLYIPSTINMWEKLLSTAIWADKNNLVVFYSEFIPFWMYFYPKNLKSERNKPWFNFLLHTQSMVCATV